MSSVIPWDAIGNTDMGEVIQAWDQFVEDEKKKMEWEILVADRISVGVANNLHKILKPIWKFIFRK